MRPPLAVTERIKSGATSDSFRFLSWEMKPVKQLLHWTTVLHGLFLKAFRKPLRKNSSAFHFLNWIMTSRIFHLPSAWWNRRQLDWGCFWIFTDRLIPCLCQKSTLPCLRLPTLMRAGAKNKKASKGPSWNGLLAIPKDVIPSELRLGRFFSQKW